MSQNKCIWPTIVLVLSFRQAQQNGSVKDSEGQVGGVSGRGFKAFPTFPFICLLWSQEFTSQYLTMPAKLQVKIMLWVLQPNHWRVENTRILKVFFFTGLFLLLKCTTAFEKFLHCPVEGRLAISISPPPPHYGAWEVQQVCYTLMLNLSYLLAWNSQVLLFIVDRNKLLKEFIVKSAVSVWHIVSFNVQLNFQTDRSLDFSNAPESGPANVTAGWGNLMPE